MSHGTIVTDGKKTILVPTGCVGMSTAGSGDVLSGILTGVLGQKFDDVLKATSYAVYLNGLAGESAQKEVGDISLVASDTISNIPAAIRVLRQANGIEIR